MGYTISTIRRLPGPDNDLVWYIYIFGDVRISNRINDLFTKEFEIVADRIGEQAALIKPLNRQRIEHEVMQKLDNLDWEHLDKLKKIEEAGPSLLLIKSHPDNIKKDTPIIAVSFSNLEKIYSDNNTLVTELSDFVKGDNLNFTKKLAKQNSILRKFSLSFSVGLFSLNYDL